MSAPETPRERTLHDDAPPADTPFPVSPRVAAALVTIAVLWLVGMAAAALVAGVGSGAASEGWRLTLLQAGSVVGFLAFAVAGVAAVIVLERRDRGR